MDFGRLKAVRSFDTSGTAHPAHSVTSQNTGTLGYTAVRTSELAGARTARPVVGSFSFLSPRLDLAVVKRNK